VTERLENVTFAPADKLGFAGKPDSLSIGEAPGFAAELFQKNAILFLEVFDDGLLMAIHPAGNGDEEELELSCHATEDFF